ncbi:MAG: LemA family protein [Pirellulales bacterium]|nr:LemA family protein [Pirellulales bacterium]
MLSVNVLILAWTGINAALVILASGVFVLIAGWAIFAYNHLVRHANLVREGWSGIDVQLKRRHDLVPSLVETVKGYANFERGLLEKITDLRARAAGNTTIEDRQKDENALSGSLKSLFAVAEAYPQLQANRSFLDLQNQLVGIEDNLQMARRYYNGTVRDYNICAESFPSNVIANLFRFEPAQYFQIETATERNLPEVNF